MTVVTRWQSRLRTRERLLKAARKRHEVVHSATSRALLSKRKTQVRFAERVIARHVRKVNANPVLLRAAQLIAGFEGGQSPDGLFHAYWDQYGRVWTIGYGHTEGVTQSSRSLTKAQALRLLAYDLSKKYAPPVLALKLPRSGMTVAVISIVYNCGPGIVGRGHTLGDALRAHDWRAASGAFMLYDKAGGTVLDGLRNRRAAERRVFDS